MKDPEFKPVIDLVYFLSHQSEQFKSLKVVGIKDYIEPIQDETRSDEEVIYIEAYLN